VDKKYAPTKAEEEAIAAEFEKSKPDWPRSTTFPDTHGLRALIKEKYGRDKPVLFEFRNAEGRICFVQERVVNEQSLEKSDLPWSYWSDGQWRMMEPDGDLPLYGLDQLKNPTASIFIHEGAKTAKHVGWLTGIDDWGRGRTYEAGEGLERFPLFVNRGDSLSVANKILWSPRIEGACHGLFERLACSSDPSGRGWNGGAGGGAPVRDWRFDRDPLGQAVAGDGQFRGQIQQGPEPIAAQASGGMAARSGAAEARFDPGRNPAPSAQ